MKSGKCEICQADTIHRGPCGQWRLQGLAPDTAEVTEFAFCSSAHLLLWLKEHVDKIPIWNSSRELKCAVCQRPARDEFWFFDPYRPPYDFYFCGLVHKSWWLDSPCPV